MASPIDVVKTNHSEPPEQYVWSICNLARAMSATVGCHLAHRVDSLAADLIPNGVNANSDWGFPKPRKCDSIAAYLGGRSDGCSNSITVGF